MSDEAEEWRKNLTGRGDSGRGQGRKPISEAEPTLEAAITLPRSYWERLRELGDGNASAGVRRLLEEHDKR